MYCVRGNYEFGITRVMDSLRPLDKKLGADTWYYTKRVFLSLIENLAKHLLVIKDSVMRDCVHFLDQCDSKLYYWSLVTSQSHSRVKHSAFTTASIGLWLPSIHCP